MNENIKRSFWFHLLMVLLVFSFFYIAFFFTLGFLTHHGEKLQLPNLVGKPLNQAVDELHRLNFEYKVDSAYDSKYKPLAVIKQIPEIGSFVKSGRTVLLTVNRISPPFVKMVALTDLPFGNAMVQLRNNKLNVGDTTYVPNDAEGIVTRQFYKGREIRAGEQIPEGSRIDLEIGNGVGKSEFKVPDLIGQEVDYARTLTDQYHLLTLYIVPMDAGVIIDTLSAIVIDQTPRPFDEHGNPNMIKMGEEIDLFLKQKPSPEDFPKYK